ncbi:type II toxin-antitoxin system RelB/DinJ family antitoxin [Lactobacillus sp. PV037]|nr:type II toxin-antitoxin system RelB/DinJ family antitoxin [Lactobacillus sp. PV012]QNQ84434.1 type II toxin-antitoxin system RelB/DinJ family antitoxin [Lactobacillus sp. PV037]
MNFKVDASTKKLFNQAAEKMGLTSSALLNIFVTRVAREQAVPFSLKVVPNKNETFDEESKNAMIKELAIVNGLIPDDDNKVDDLDDYFKKLGV